MYNLNVYNWEQANVGQKEDGRDEEEYKYRDVKGKMWKPCTFLFPYYKIVWINQDIV